VILLLEHLSEKEKILIGLCIEFEGSVGIYKNCLYLAIQNINRKSLETFQEIVGCGKVVLSKKAHGKFKKVWEWRLRGSYENRKHNYPHIAYQFYLAIEPYLTSKAGKLKSYNPSVR
jgi:hypothetical protein